jgi:steroid delta-isomerase-like uncharacterized protein
MLGESLRARREAVVREHMESENRHEFDVTMATFHHPRYEIVPTGDVYDGEEEVARYFAETRAAFPDQRNELIRMYHADDAVIVEFDLKGTHEGPLRGIPATGRAFTCRTLAIFEFEEEGEGIVCERVYFDVATILGQLGLTGG